MDLNEVIIHLLIPGDRAWWRIWWWQHSSALFIGPEIIDPRNPPDFLQSEIQEDIKI